MRLDEMVLAHGQQLLVLGVQVSRISAVLGIDASGADPQACPVCGKLVPPNADGVLPPHQIDGAVLAPGRRRSGSVCRYRPAAASSETSTVSTVTVGTVA